MPTTPLDYETPEGHYWLERLTDWHHHQEPWVNHNGIVFDAEWQIQFPRALDREER